MLTMYVVHTDRDLTDLTSVPDRRAGFLTGSFSTPCILSQGVPPKTVLSAIVLSKNKKNVMQQCDLSNGYPFVQWKKYLSKSVYTLKVLFV